MKSEKSFRKNLVGGFNTRDVVEYLAQMAKERRDETEALRAGAEKLRRERDAALDNPPPPPADTQEAENLRRRLDILARENEALKQTAAVLDTRMAELQSQLAGRQEQVKQLEQRRQEEHARADAAQSQAAEAQSKADAAQSKAEEAQSQAAAAQARAEALESAAGQIIADTRQNFDDAMAHGRSAALSIVLELDKMRDFFAHFTDNFTVAEESIVRMETTRKHLVRTFVPSEFFEEMAPHESGKVIKPVPNEPEQ